MDAHWRACDEIQGSVARAANERRPGRTARCTRASKNQTGSRASPSMWHEDPVTDRTHGPPSRGMVRSGESVHAGNHSMPFFANVQVPRTARVVTDLPSTGASHTVAARQPQFTPRGPVNRAPPGGSPCSQPLTPAPGLGIADRHTEGRESFRRRRHHELGAARNSPGANSSARAGACSSPSALPHDAGRKVPHRAPAWPSMALADPGPAC
jgi:hypothetical protein